MALKMLRDNIAVIPLEDPQKATSLIYRPDTAKQRPDQGIVAYRGPDCKHIRTGMHVLFSGYTGTRVVIADEGDFIIMSERDVDLILTQEPVHLLTYEQVEEALRRTSAWPSDIESYMEQVLADLRTLPTASMEF